VRAAESDEVEELVFVLLEVRKRRSADDATQAVGDEADLVQAIAWAILGDVVVYFLSQAHTHVADIALSLVLVGGRHEEHDLWEYQGNIVPDDLHILGVSLVAMHEHPQVHAVLVVFLRCLFDALVELLFQGLLLLQRLLF